MAGTMHALWASRGRVLEDIEREARQLNPVRVLLTVIAIPFFLVGWIIGHLAKFVWVAFTWIWTATVVGWRMARKPTAGDGG